MPITIELERVNDAFHFEARNSEGVAVQIDGAAEIGGQGAGVRPMQLLLMGLGGCSGIDIGLILRKQKQVIESFRIVINGYREQHKKPALFENITVEFHLHGDLDAGKVKRAVSLSMDKYCSVTKTLEKSASISYSALLNGERL